MNKRQQMPRQDPAERIHNFNEVALGYTEEQAVREAERCIQCKKAPCKAGCPVEIDIPSFIKAIKEKNFACAIEIIKEKNNLPAVCGRVCPQEMQCEKVCTLGKKLEPVAIGRLERFVADWQLEKKGDSPRPASAGAPTTSSVNSNSPRVAVIGSGPAGLTCAADLAKMGYKVTIFESLHNTGGVLRYGIPEFRMPKHILDAEINYIKSLGVEIMVNTLVGESITLKDMLENEYKAIFIGTGAGLPYFMGIKGENLNGVYSANEFLTRVNLMKAYEFPQYDTPLKIGNRVAVIGAGNVSMDSARVSLRLGAKEVWIVYRRSEIEMPARIEEIENAREEGVRFNLLTLPVEIVDDERNWVKAMKCIKMKLGEPDQSGRRRPIPIEGSEFTMEIDTVIVAIGQGPNPLLPMKTQGLKIGKHGNIIAKSLTGETSIKGVFAGGDIVSGAATVIEAMGAGKRAARAIDEYLKKEK
ncbi:glutamate synthase (NADPH), homotetrameric [Candidatus Desantisbacteria bacterium CG1_02_38_46]|uniref:Glutamate synthase (NADPH), homotetrameric n=3 Tax=unclassified Candidatus Desantisiibacteriota TaxID=3106372 RepID=A0A2H9PC53_9BACT|nr:MAG: glutamate synthase (NADPH), homotetrameric [Candidatus Desantisbacteria bacterium CG1_02_38_46]PIU50987.1 MAG: glutamate synthase (NADPH), homotetrameric [Candidatus Desantisbacteria bacterium CG07_land_8_20_14_0_80_39_15]PIZ16601.1 MAG: glutamate synthase (NADPH), homotetrameric [Candidatus Desantisbacteria bacterium CG_4_10_14_0_8_um_filter_39_17]